MEKAIAGILLLITLLIAVIFLIGEGMIHRTRKSSAAPDRAAEEPVRPPPDPMEPPALAALEAFFEAPDLATKAALVRDGTRVFPMMDDYHRRREHPLPTLSRTSKGKVAIIDGTPMVFFEVEPFSGPQFPVAVIWDGHRFAVDWESLTAYGTIDWGEFIEKRPTTGNTLRVYLQAANEVEKIPGAAAGSVAFRIEHRDDPQPVIALADSQTAAVLSPLVIGRRVPVTLELAWRKSATGAAPVPEIVRLVAPKWSE